MQDTTIKTRPDGSIDTAYYMAKGRMARSRAAHQIIGKTANVPAETTERTTRKLFSWMRAPLVLKVR